MAKHRKCDGCGCPECLGTGKSGVKRAVKAWGENHGMPDLTPEKVRDLPVRDQRLVQSWVRAIID